MGNWRTVSIEGSIAPEHVAALKAALRWDMDDLDAEPGPGPLSFYPSLGGLGPWPAPEVKAGGNLFERDYSVESVAEHIRHVVLPAAPSAALKVHCDDDWEDTTCIATITVADGQVTVGDPEVETVSGVGSAQFQERLAQILGAQW